MAKKLEFAMLLDCYGELLTEKQRKAMELYYYEDLSYAEIGEPDEISRQAACGLIKRSESLLLMYEEKLGLAKLLVSMRQCLENIDGAADRITDSNIRNTIKNEIGNGIKLL